MKKLATEELLKQIIVCLVDKPDEVEVTRKVDELGVLLTVNLGQGDAGFVIGRGGSMARSVREIVRSVGLKNRERINIKIDVPMLKKREEDLDLG